jgi:predicted CoA-binding protein
VPSLWRHGQHSSSVCEHDRSPARVNHDSYSDAYIGGILASCRTFAFVGASPTQSRPSYFAMKYLMAKGYRVIPVNPGHAGKELLGQKIYASLADIEEPVDVVDMFRAPDAAPEILREAIAIGAKVMWMQLGIRTDEAATMAEDAGLKVVMNRCPKIEYGRLSGEIGWVGVNRRVIDNRKPFLFGKGGTMKHRV